MEPVIIINFKTYLESTGEKAENLAKICETVSNKTGIKVIVCVQNSDLYRVSHKVKIDVFGQHADPVNPGAFTGHQVPEALLANGAKGVVINHSEHPMKIDDIEKVVLKCKVLKLSVLVCAPTAEIAKQVAKFNPDFVAVEPPELIGSGISVTSANPSIVVDSVKNVKSVMNVAVLCGAGISNGHDVEKAIELGTVGVLLASGVVKAKNPEEVMLDLCNGAMVAKKKLVK